MAERRIQRLKKLWADRVELMASTQLESILFRLLLRSTLNDVFSPLASKAIVAVRVNPRLSGTLNAIMRAGRHTSSQRAEASPSISAGGWLRKVYHEGDIPKSGLCSTGI